MKELPSLKGGAGVGGAGAGGMIQKAIRSGWRHGVDLKPGRKNPAVGNCSFEVKDSNSSYFDDFMYFLQATIFNIEDREEIKEKVNVDISTARQKWVTELQEVITNYYPEMIPDNLDRELTPMENQQLIKSGWEKLKKDGAYEIDFFGDLLMQAISRGSRKQILIFTTNEDSPNDPIVVVSPETYGGTTDSTVPVVVAYNGRHFESLHPIGEASIEKTKELCQQYTNGTYPYKPKDIEKLTSAYTSAEKKQRSRNKERLSLKVTLIKTSTWGGGGAIRFG